MKNKDNKKKEKVTFKELWHHPIYNSLIKLGLWGIFFIIVYIFIFVGNSANRQVSNTSQSTTTQAIKTNYSTLKNNLLEAPQDIIYTINNYFLTGEIKDNILTATLEDDENTIKIKYDGDKIYQLKKTEEEINEEILTDINKEYLLPSKIIEIIDDPKVISTKSADEKIYSYNVDGKAISVYIGEDYIEKIIILDNEITYNLEFKEVGVK